MDNSDLANPRLARASATHDDDETGLLIGTGLPHARAHASSVRKSDTRRGRHSRGGSNIELQPIQEGISPNSLDVESDRSAQAPPKNRPRSPIPAAASSIIRRLSTLRHPVAKSISSISGVRDPAGHYENLDESEADAVAVDLSSLGGLGYEVTYSTALPSSSLTQQETAYLRPGERPEPPEKPAFQTFVRNGSRIGEGMVIGAQLKPNPSNAGLAPDAASRARSQKEAFRRSKTVRDIGHNLAQERQVIVAVNESVTDLSSLGGSLEEPPESSRLTHRATHQSFETMALPTSTSKDVMPTSYFYPDDPDVPNWRPFSLSRPYIIGLIVVSLALGSIQEWLCELSMAKAHENNGAILAFDNVSDISRGAFFVWKYLPTMVIITYAVLWSIMDFDIRRLEPYYQLSRPLGSRAGASLNLDHTTMFQYFIPFKAFRLRQWAVFFSSVGNIVTSLVAPALQNASIGFNSNTACPNTTDTCPDGQHHYQVQMIPGFSRALSAFLFLTAICGMILLYLMRRKSGLLSDPKGIAGIASMATKSHILHDFHGMDLATRGKIHEKLQHRQYVLYKSSIWQGEWKRSEEAMQESERSLQSPHPFTLRLRFGIPFIITMVVILIFVPLISVTKLNVIPNNFPWLPILVATVLKLVWTTFESDVRLMEPFYNLSKGNARPEESLTLDYQGTVYGWMPIKAAMNGHWLVSLVGISSIALDVLAVAVSSFSVPTSMFLQGGSQNSSSQGEDFASFWTSVVLSLFIMTFVIVTAVLVYLLRRHPFLPREPSTIAAVLAFIYASNMLDDFIDTERLNGRQMEERLKEISQNKGKRYGLGWFKGRDGNLHCAIDEEPMRSRYVHGVSYKEAQAPWDTRDQDFV